MTPLEVAAGIVVGPAGVLCARRPAGAHQAGLWEFPGGKRRPGESLPAALRRELWEELGVEVEVGACRGAAAHAYADAPAVRVHFYVCRLRSGQPRALQAAEVRWWPPRALAALSCPPPDRPYFDRVAGLRRAEDLWQAPDPDADPNPDPNPNPNPDAGGPFS